MQSMFSDDVGTAVCVLIELFKFLQCHASSLQTMNAENRLPQTRATSKVTNVLKWLL